MLTNFLLALVRSWEAASFQMNPAIPYWTGPDWTGLEGFFRPLGCCQEQGMKSFTGPNVNTVKGCMDQKTIKQFTNL